jgi:hypothetical protein
MLNLLASRKDAKRVPPLSKGSSERPSFKRLVDAINHMPADAAYIEAVPFKNLERLLLFGEPEQKRAAAESVRSQFSGVAPVVSMYLFRGRELSADNPAGALEAIELWNQLIAVRNFFISVANQPELLPGEMSLSEFTILFTILNRWQRLVSPVIEPRNSSSTSKTGARLLRFKKSPLLEVLEGIDLTRIMDCKSCRLFFWATKNHKQTCGKKKCQKAARTNHERDQTVPSTRIIWRVVRSMPESQFEPPLTSVPQSADRGLNRIEYMNEEAVRILEVFRRRNARSGTFISFADLSEAIVLDEQGRNALRFLIGEAFVEEAGNGLILTTKGEQELYPTDSPKHGARVYRLGSGLVVKQTVLRGTPAEYIIDEHCERTVRPDDDAAIASAVRAALEGKL